MKYNPKVNNDVASLPGFAQHHPYTPDILSQGSIQLMFELQEYLKEISGMDHVSLQPAAGAQGELTGMLMIHAYHAAQGVQRKKNYPTRFCTWNQSCHRKLMWLQRNSNTVGRTWPYRSMQTGVCYGRRKLRR